MSIHFLSESETLDKLTKSLPTEQQQEITSLKHRRVEMGFKDRKFIVYKYQNRKVQILANLMVRDFICNDDDGCSFDLECIETGDHLIVGHTPVKLWELPVYASVPCHPRLMYALPQGDADITHSLAFPILLRTQSRLSLSESGVIYMETVKSFVETFPDYSEE